MELVVIGLVSLLAGIFASMGLGGGMILIVYLTIIKEIPQLSAQGINLVFFIPIAVFSIILHTRKKLVKYKEIMPAILCGIITTVLFSIIANRINSTLLEKSFAVFLIIVGIRELMTKKDAHKNSAS